MQAAAYHLTRRDYAVEWNERLFGERLGHGPSLGVRFGISGHQNKIADGSGRG
jgi:hypothetical protein